MTSLIHRIAPSKPRKQYVSQIQIPHHALDTLREKLGATSDRQLADKLGLTTPVVSKMRSGKINFSAATIILIHENTDLPIATIKAMLR